jgi:hypothetical protein
MKVLTAEDLGVETVEGVETTGFDLRLSSLLPQADSSTLPEQRETFLRDRFGIKLENPITGEWICSWRTAGN